MHGLLPLHVILVHGLLPLHAVLVVRIFAVACDFGCTDFRHCMQFWLYELLENECLFWLLETRRMIDKPNDVHYNVHRKR